MPKEKKRMMLKIKKYENIAQAIFDDALNKMHTLDPTFSYGPTGVPSRVDNKNVPNNATNNNDVIVNLNTITISSQGDFSENNEELGQYPPIPSEIQDVTSSPETPMAQSKLTSPHQKYAFEIIDDNDTMDNNNNNTNNTTVNQNVSGITTQQPLIKADSLQVPATSISSKLNAHRKSLSANTTIPIIMQHSHKSSVPIYFIPAKISEMQQKENENENEKEKKKESKKKVVIKKLKNSRKNCKNKCYKN